MERWRPEARGRRRTVFALALLAHAALVSGMLAARVRIDAVPAATSVEATIWMPPTPAPAPVPRSLAPPPPPPRLARLRALPVVGADPQAVAAPLLEPQVAADAASAAAPAASAASEPLQLTLSREQLRALIAGTRPTLAQSLARGPAPSALARIGGDEAPYEEVPLPGGETEVHVHGGCFRLVPTARSQYDPFNHGNERLTTACK
jgi:hypothetical protein